MTTKKSILNNPLFLGTIPALLIGIILYYLQYFHQRKTNREDTQTAKIERLERQHIADSMEHRQFNIRIRRLERQNP